MCKSKNRISFLAAALVTRFNVGFAMGKQTGNIHKCIYVRVCMHTYIHMNYVRSITVVKSCFSLPSLSVSCDGYSFAHGKPPHTHKFQTAMGKEAGYLPPVQSIKAQVMNGTLLSSGTFKYHLPQPSHPCHCLHIFFSLMVSLSNSFSATPLSMPVY
jgi:hypothetical protein